MTRLELKYFNSYETKIIRFLIARRKLKNGISTKQIAKMTKMHEKTALSYLYHLKERGWIIITERYANRIYWNFNNRLYEKLIKNE